MFKLTKLCFHLEYDIKVKETFDKKTSNFWKDQKDALLANLPSSLICSDSLFFPITQKREKNDHTNNVNYKQVAQSLRTIRKRTKQIGELFILSVLSSQKQFSHQTLCRKNEKIKCNLNGN